MSRARVIFLSTDVISILTSTIQFIEESCDETQFIKIYIGEVSCFLILPRRPCRGYATFDPQVEQGSSLQSNVYVVDGSWLQEPYGSLEELAKTALREDFFPLLALYFVILMVILFFISSRLHWLFHYKLYLYCCIQVVLSLMVIRYFIAQLL